MGQDAAVNQEKWDVYDAPDGAARPETRAAAGDPVPTVVQEVGGGRRRRSPALVGASIGLALLSGGLFGVIHSRSADRHREPAVAFAPTLVPARFDAFVTALRKRAGTTRVQTFSAYDGDFTVEVPPATKGGRSRSYSFYGDSGLRDMGDGLNVGPRRTFDRATLDVDALEGLFDRAWHKVPVDVSGSSLRVEPPTQAGQHWVTIYIHETDDGFYAVDGDLDGTLVSMEEID
jgi:hypothetical protein